MTMSIYESTREIGGIRATCASREIVYRLFNLETTLIGFGGGVVGIAIW